MIESPLPMTKENTPPHLQERPGETAPIAKLLVWFNKVREQSSQLKIINKELIPTQGPYLLISNHFGGRGLDLFALDEQIRIVTGQTANWDNTSIHRAIMNGIGAVPIIESLANTTGEERDRLMGRLPTELDRKIFERVEALESAESSLERGMKLIKQIRVIVDVLADGGKVAIFPEGLKQFKDELHQAYRGFLIIAERYKKLTDKDLLIVPVGMTKNNLQTVLNVGLPFSLAENNTKEDDLDWSMYQIARLLPEQQRGVYKAIPKSLLD